MSKSKKHSLRPDGKPLSISSGKSEEEKETVEINGEKYEIKKRDSGSVPEPLPSGLKPVPAFSPDTVPEVFAAFIIDCANRLQCSADFIAVTLISAFSGTVGRRVAITPNRDSWKVIPNLWGAIIGRPGFMKSPAMTAALLPTKRIEDEYRKRFQKELEEYESTKRLADLVVKDFERLAKNAVQKKDLKLAAEHLEDSKDQQPASPKLKRLTVNDPTVEALGEILSSNPSGLIVLRDELTGWLKSLGKDGHETARSFYLEGWNGDTPHTVDRISRGHLFIPACCVTIFGGIQPGKLAPLIRSAVSQSLDDDGLLQRFQLMVYPDQSSEWNPGAKFEDENAKEEICELFKFAVSLEQFETPETLHFDKVAQECWNDYLHALELELRGGELHASLESHFGKYRSLVPSLALLFHLAETRAMSPVPVSSLNQAIQFAAYLRCHAERIYGLSLERKVVAAKALLKKLDKLPQPFTHRDVYRKCWSGLNRESTVDAIQLLQDYGWVKELEWPGQSEKGGRNTYRYVASKNKGGVPYEEAE